MKSKRKGDPAEFYVTAAMCGCIILVMVTFGIAVIIDGFRPPLVAHEFTVERDSAGYTVTLTETGKRLHADKIEVGEECYVEYKDDSHKAVRVVLTTDKAEGFCMVTVDSGE